MSHGTRAYIVNADGLLGFVYDPKIDRILKNSDENGQFSDEKEYQIIDINKVL